MKVLITSGGTKEHLDAVRVLTNVSTGKLGAKIAEKFLKEGHEVIYVSPETAVGASLSKVWCPIEIKYRRVTISNVDSLMKVMEEWVPKVDVVIHSAAVSDFTFDTSIPVKVGSSSAEDFVRYIQSTIKKTPKVISNFRYWNSEAILVGFKFTVGQTEDGLCKIAEDLMLKNNLDFVFANDKEIMKANKEHIGFLLKFDPKFTYRNHEKGIDVSSKENCFGKENIAEVIYKNVMDLYNTKNSNKEK